MLKMTALHDNGIISTKKQTTAFTKKQNKTEKQEKNQTSQPPKTKTKTPQPTADWKVLRNERIYTPFYTLINCPQCEKSKI